MINLNLKILEDFRFHSLILAIELMSVIKMDSFSQLPVFRISYPIMHSFLANILHSFIFLYSLIYISTQSMFDMIFSLIYEYENLFRKYTKIECNGKNIYLLTGYI